MRLKSEKVLNFGKLKYSEELNTAWENIKENIKISGKDDRTKPIKPTFIRMT
jgi:hypothetical protein